ncbi:PIN domain-containing protein [bacterium]|nr:MAG: PIN domain-containing protein [bacterium]
MKIDFIADTNFLIYVHEGNEFIYDFLDYSFGISFITEIELLGHAKLSKFEEKKLKELIGSCMYVDWSQMLKEETIRLRKSYSLKHPDAIIAATAIHLKTPLITADKGFAKVDELDLVLLDF